MEMKRGGGGAEIKCQTAAEGWDHGSSRAEQKILNLENRMVPEKRSKDKDIWVLQ